MKFGHLSSQKMWVWGGKLKLKGKEMPKDCKHNKLEGWYYVKDVLRSYIGSIYHMWSLAVSHFWWLHSQMTKICFESPYLQETEQGGKWQESGDKGTGSRRTGYRKWEVLDPSLLTLGWVEVMVRWEIVFLPWCYRTAFLKRRPHVKGKMFVCFVFPILLKLKTI